MDKEKIAPEKIVIVAGPTFGDAMHFVLLGAVLGAGTVLYLKTRGAAGEAGTASPRSAESGAKIEARSVDLSERLNKLSKKVKALAGKAGETAAVVGGAVGPIVRGAVEEGKNAAHRTQQEMADQLKNEPDTVFATPAIEPEKA